MNCSSSLLRAAIALAALASIGAAATAAAADTSTPQPAETDFIYRAKTGDTLIGLGKTLLAKPNDWPQVQRLNALALLETAGRRPRKPSFVGALRMNASDAPGR